MTHIILKKIRQAPLAIRLTFFFSLVILALVPNLLWNLIQHTPNPVFNIGRTYSFSVLYPGCFLLLYCWGKMINQQPHPYRHYGITFNRQSSRECLLGFAFGLVGVLLYYGYYLASGAITFNPHPLQSLSQLSSAGIWLIGAFALVFIEELFFRGFIISETLRATNKYRYALLLSSILFALLHFKIKAVLPLFLMGWILAEGKRYFNGRILFCIGLHSGWIYFFNLNGIVKFFIQPHSSTSLILSDPLRTYTIIVLLLLQYAALFALQRYKHSNTIHTDRIKEAPEC